MKELNLEVVVASINEIAVMDVITIEEGHPLCATRVAEMTIAIEKNVTLRLPKLKTKFL